MISVNVTKLGTYPVSSKRIKDVVVGFLKQNGIVSDAVVDVAFVSRETMDELNNKYYKDEVYEHPIFTFIEPEADFFVMPPDKKLYLGQMVINYPMAVETAREKNQLVEKVIVELVTHGCLHLIGKHHS
jgi:rRNA maturation RNase YbeY